MKYPAIKHIITGGIITSLLLISQVFALPDTNKEVLSQKILLENTIHQRVSDAVYRILRHENFIVNVNVIMEATPTQKYTTVYEAPGSVKGKATPEQEIFKQSLRKTPGMTQVTPETSDDPTAKKTRTVLKKRPIKTDIPSDIPGFPGIQSPGFELYEEEVAVEEDNNEDVVYAAAEDLEVVAEFPDTTKAEVAAEASLSLEEDEVILEEDFENVSETNVQDESLDAYSDATNAKLSRHTVASISGPSLRVEKMELTVILEDPISPQIIENIRTVTMVAAHFNRERGDKLQVMTADFQGATTDKPDTEQLLLKSIAEKMTAIEARQKEEAENERIKELEAQQAQMKIDQANKEARDAEMARIRQEEADKQKAYEAELAKLKQQEEERIRERENELRELREQEENRLAEERRQLFEAQQEQAQDRLRQDSLRLALLTEQLEDLKDQLSAVDLEEEQRLKLELEQKRREAEKSAIKDREDRLKQQMDELESQRLQATMIPEDDDDLLWLFIIGAAVLVGLAVIIGALMGGRRSTPEPPIATDMAQPEVEPEPEPEIEEAPAEELEPEPEVDPELVDEVDSIKKSVVSLAVSKPGSASSIVKDWLQDTGEAEEEETAEEETEDDTSKGKKKKKGQK